MRFDKVGLDLGREFEDGDLFERRRGRGGSARSPREVKRTTHKLETPLPNLKLILPTSSKPIHALLHRLLQPRQLLPRHARLELHSSATSYIVQVAERVGILVINLGERVVLI